MLTEVTVVRIWYSGKKIGGEIFVHLYSSHNIHLLHPLLLNTKIYYTQGGNIFQAEWNIRHRGCNKSGIQYSRGCNNCFIIHVKRKSLWI